MSTTTNCTNFFCNMLHLTNMGTLCSNTAIDNRSKDVLSTHYTFTKTIFSGPLTKVRLVHRINEPSLIFAVKSIMKNKLDCNFNSMSDEIKILQKLDHPNIIKLYEVYEDEFAYHLVSEYCSGGELFEHISQKGHLSENESRNIIKKILLAVNHLHVNGIVHRDLKPENFLFEGNEIKLIDFGLSKICKETYMKTLVGSAHYLAPEMLRGKYDAKCDMWAVGVIMYTMICGKHPFYGANNKEIFKKILGGTFNFNDEI